MADSLFSKLKNAWNVFRNYEIEETYGTSRSQLTPSILTGGQNRYYGRGYGERSIIASIYTQMAIDVAAVDIRHARIGDNGQFLSNIHSKLHECLTLNANLDQSARALKQDLAMTIFEKGHACVVPVDTSINPNTGSFDILSLRVGVVTEWFSEKVVVRLYNQKKGVHEDILLNKSFVAIIENPFYSVMNEQNSTLQRLIRKLSLLDAIDEQLGSGKLDLIIQLPYVIKTEARREQAENRRKDIEMQLKGAQYGIAYTDGTERITQLNRPAENNLLKQVEWLTQKLYGELGMTPAVIDGTADEQVMLNYFNRTIEPVLVSITEEFTRKFLTLTARTQGQYIKAMRNPFNLVPIGNIAEMADKFTRNEILSSNELRGIIGFYPSNDPKADELRNANISAPKEEVAPEEKTESSPNLEDVPTKKLSPADKKKVLARILAKSLPKEKEINQNES